MFSLNEDGRALRRNGDIWLLAAAAVLFFFIYSFPTSYGAPRFVSPDETANFAFARQFAEHTTLILPSVTVDGEPAPLVRPRSVAIVEQGLVPESFTGIMVWSGLVAKVVGLWVIRFLTPAIAAAAVPFFYLLVRKFFGQRVALPAALLLFIHPAYWYVSSRSMMHNGLFIALFIIAIWCLVRIGRTRGGGGAAAGALILTFLALTVRTSEIWWVGLLAVVGFFFFKGRRWVYVVTVGAGFMIAIAYLLLVHNSLFGSPFAGGYTPVVSSAEGGGMLASNLASTFARIVLPFGFQPSWLVTNVSRYLILAFVWFAIPTIIGLALALRRFGVDLFRRGVRAIDSAEHRYLILYLIAGLWLIVYYGSWPLVEYADPNKIILGASFVRYWLPLYVFGIPFCIRGIESVVLLLKRRWLKRVALAAIGVWAVVSSVQLVVDDPLYGLAKVRSDIREYQVINERAVSVTPANAVIIAGTADKVFFPERQVIVDVDFDSIAELNTLEVLADQAPLYYYCLTFDETCQTLQQQPVTARVVLREGVELSSERILYKIDVR